MSELAISADDVRAAAGLVGGLVHRTPVMTSRSANERADAELFFKCENLQRTGSFKIRGAANLLRSLSRDECRRGVVAFSSGNHAQAVAIMAEALGAPAYIAMPLDAPRSKVEATRAHGANIITYDRFREDREAVAARLLAETGGTLAPPFDHPKIMAGQGTVGLELLQEAGPLDALVVCVGGGGLLSGVATIAKSMQLGIRIYGVEPARGSDVFQSLRAGHRVTIEPPDTIADGLRTPSPGKFTFPVIQALVEDVLLVTEDDIRDAMRFFMERMKLVVEPSGAVGAAAVFAAKLPKDLKRIGVVISGGNVDRDFLKTL